MNSKRANMEIWNMWLWKSKIRAHFGKWRCTKHGHTKKSPRISILWTTTPRFETRKNLRTQTTDMYKCVENRSSHKYELHFHPWISNVLFWTRIPHIIWLIFHGFFLCTLSAIWVSQTKPKDVCLCVWYFRVTDCMSEKIFLRTQVAQTRPPLNQRLMTHSTRGFPVKIRPRGPPESKN